jgi:hypothetical protein
MDGGADRQESQSFQQVTWNIGSIARLKTQSRTRLE